MAASGLRLSLGWRPIGAFNFTSRVTLSLMFTAVEASPSTEVCSSAICNFGTTSAGSKKAERCDSFPAAVRFLDASGDDTEPSTNLEASAVCELFAVCGKTSSSSRVFERLNFNLSSGSAEAWSRGSDWMTVMNCRIDWLTEYVVDLWKVCKWFSKGVWLVVGCWNSAVSQLGDKDAISASSMLADAVGNATQLGRRGEREGVMKDERGREETVMWGGIAG